MKETSIWTSFSYWGITVDFITFKSDIVSSDAAELNEGKITWCWRNALKYYSPEKEKGIKQKSKMFDNYLIRWCECGSSWYCFSL